MVDNSNIEKLTESFFPGKFIFGPNLGKKYLAEWLQKRFFFFFFLNFGHVSFSEKLSIMKTNIVFDISPTYLV